MNYYFFLFFIATLSTVKALSGDYMSKLKSGPMVGHTTDNSAKIWGYDSSTRNLKLYYARAGTNAIKSVNFFPRTQRGRKRSAQVTLTGLTASTKYNYEIRNGGEVLARAHFTTAPRQGQKTSFTYLLTSCMDNSPHKGYPKQPVWKFADQVGNPSFALLNGDPIYMRSGEYSPSINYDKVWTAYERIRDVEHLDAFIATHPSYGSWDDHDFGQNDAGKGQRGKDVSLQIWKDMWANPYTGAPGITGNFYDFYWGDSHFIVLDNRWNREGGNVQFGPKQLEWLYGKLKSSRGVFKVIVAGTNVLHGGGEVNKIGEVVKQFNINGVVFHTGDIHRNDFRMDNFNSWPYPVVQFTSSGIGRHVRRPFAVMKIDTQKADPEISVKFYRAKESCAWKDYGDAGCPASKNVWNHNANVKCRNVIGNHNLLGNCAETIRLSEISTGKTNPSPRPTTPTPTPRPTIPTPRPVPVPRPMDDGMCGYSTSDKAYVLDCTTSCRGGRCRTRLGFQNCAACDDEDDDHGPAKVFKSLGCFKDQSNPRTFKKNLGRNGQTTNKWCSDKCKKLGFDYSATQHSTQCFCGTLAEYNNAVKNRKVSNNNCNKKCGGNSGEICGGSWRMTISGYVVPGTHNLEDNEEIEETQTQETQTQETQVTEMKEDDSEASDVAIAAIVIGCLAFVMLLVLVVLFFIRK